MNFNLSGVNTISLTSRMCFIFAGAIILYSALLFGCGLKTGIVVSCGHQEPWTMPVPGGGHIVIYPEHLRVAPVIGDFGMPYVEERKGGE